MEKLVMFKPVSHYITSKGFDGFHVRHLFKPSWFKTEEELDEAYQELFDWLNENCDGEYEATSMDNAAFSDYNEDPWVGYYITIYDPELAMAFKLRWIS